jgi:PmbA protein
MDQRLIDALQAHPAIDDWTARRQVGESAQIYIVGEVVENVRLVTRESYEIEIHNDHAHDGTDVRGSVTIPVAAADLARLNAILDNAVTMASLVHNAPWELPEPAAAADVPLADPLLLTSDGALAAGRDAADLIRDLAHRERAQDVRLSAAELFLSHVDEELRSSRGIHLASESTRVLLEATVLADGTGGGTDAEFFQQVQTRRIEDLALDAAIPRAARFAQEKLIARVPRTRLGPVVITDAAIGQLLGGTVIGGAGAYLTQASAAAAHARFSRFELGQPVYLGRERTGEALTLRANALHPYAVGSYHFDADGIPGHDLLVIEDGILRARPATQRYAQYLGVPATGRVGIIEIAPGAAPANDLGGDEPHLRVVAFSSANVDALSGDFGMEIRLGYEVGPDGPTPVAGGSVTGNLFEAMADAQFSRETVLLGDYAGPMAIRFGSLQVAGED